MGPVNPRRTCAHLPIALAEAFAIYVPGQRGRGMTPAYGEFQGLRTEIEDLTALIVRTGAKFVFGLTYAPLNFLLRRPADTPAAGWTIPS
jgi:hypothetical protein